MAEILNNAKARHNFHIMETIEAGIVLHGTEVKSLRAGKGQISEAFARVDKEQVFLHNAHIDEYAKGNINNHVPRSVRKLLLHKTEIRRLHSLVTVQNNVLVPLSFYWKNGKVKVLLGVGKGKNSVDKRDDMRNKDAAMEIKRAAMHRMGGD